MCSDIGKAKNTKFAFTILHGTEFRLKQLCCIGEFILGSFQFPLLTHTHSLTHSLLRALVVKAKNMDEFLAWTEGIGALTQREAPERYTTDEMRRRWLLKHWCALDGVAKQSIGLKDVKMWLTKVNLKLANKECKDFFQAVWSRVCFAIVAE